MQELHINSKEAAEHSRCGANIYQVQADPSCATFLPPIVGVGKMRPYNRHQYLALVIHTKLMRLGLSIPAAGKLVTRITEELFLHPDAGAVVIECHENGFNAFYAVERDDLSFERSDASRAAGPSALRVTLDIAGMWDGVNHVFATYGRRIGGEDAE
jgi:hypothetical protein